MDDPEDCEFFPEMEAYVPTVNAVHLDRDIEEEHFEAYQEDGEDRAATPDDAHKPSVSYPTEGPAEELEEVRKGAATQGRDVAACSGYRILNGVSGGDGRGVPDIDINRGGRKGVWEGGPDRPVFPRLGKLCHMMIPSAVLGARW